MAAQGMEIWHPAEQLSVMGLVEVLRHLPRLLAIRRNVYKRVLKLRPAVFIGIDAPDFNLGLESRLKREGVRTVHYVSPSVWAWREKRAAKIGHSADRVLCLFPMEPPIYAQHGVDARFVGHPLAAEFALQPDKFAARRELGLPADVPDPGLVARQSTRRDQAPGAGFSRCGSVAHARISTIAYCCTDGECGLSRGICSFVARTSRRFASAQRSALGPALPAPTRRQRPQGDDCRRCGPPRLGNGCARSDAGKAFDGRGLSSCAIELLLDQAAGHDAHANLLAAEYSRGQDPGAGIDAGRLHCRKRWPQRLRLRCAHATSHRQRWSNSSVCTNCCAAIRRMTAAAAIARADCRRVNAQTCLRIMAARIDATCAALHHNVFMTRQ